MTVAVPRYSFKPVYHTRQESNEPYCLTVCLWNYSALDILRPPLHSLVTTYTYSTDASRPFLPARNCNHFCDALVTCILPGRRIPSFINRGARVVCWLPLPGVMPWYVRRCVKHGGKEHMVVPTCYRA